MFAAIYFGLRINSSTINVKFITHENINIDSNKTIRVDVINPGLMGNLKNDCLEYCAFLDLQCVAVAYQRYHYVAILFHASLHSFSSLAL